MANDEVQLPNSVNVTRHQDSSSYEKKQAEPSISISVLSSNYDGSPDPDASDAVPAPVVLVAQNRRTGIFFAQSRSVNAITIEMIDRHNVGCKARPLVPLINWPENSIFGQFIRSPRLATWIGLLLGLAICILLTVVFVVKVESEGGPIVRLILNLAVGSLTTFSLLAMSGFIDRPLFLLVIRRFDFIVVTLSSLVSSCATVVVDTNSVYVAYDLSSVNMVCIILSHVCLVAVVVGASGIVIIMADAMPTLSRRIKSIVLYSLLAYQSFYMVRMSFLWKADDMLFCVEYAGYDNCHSIKSLARSAGGQLIIFLCRTFILVKLFLILLLTSGSTDL